ncbi:uncharacterized protein LOC134243122 [Saccostrea cucullata]|uniref:uncharacterized protein LOC134243122 n=1 Tax=Saccostrea cuccullata TaxID=36930 RepID=UPI002ED36EE4
MLILILVFVDKYRLFLSSSVPKRGNYINAITLPSYTMNKAFIITPYPQAGDAVDFLRLLTDHESDEVVCMDPLTKVESTKMWLPAANSKKPVSPFTVNCDGNKSQFKFSTITFQEGLSMDGEVDIFTAVRQLQIRRPELCSTLEEYMMISMLFWTTSGYKRKHQRKIFIATNDNILE